MTSPSHKNRPTTVCGRKRPLRTAASLSAAVLLLTAGVSNAQLWVPSPRPAPPPPPPAAEAEVLPVAAMQPRVEPPGGYRPPDPGEGTGYTIQLEPPGPERLFRLESEAALNERMRQEARDRRERITFPEEPVLSRDRYTGRAWPKQQTFAEPNYVCYRRLYFEQKNEERFGWDLGIVQPIVSTAQFFGDFVTLPYKFGTDPCRCYECSAGQCLPGQPTPYLLYPPQPSITGVVAEVAIVGALFAIFP